MGSNIWIQRNIKFRPMRWCSMSISICIENGHDNTIFFHGFAICWKKFNTIWEMQKENGSMSSYLNDTVNMRDD